MPRLELRRLNKTFRTPGGLLRPAVRDLSLTVETGELLALTGPSGGGKTTLLRLIAGLEMPDSGEIMLDGAMVAGLPPQTRDVAMVFQNLALLPHLSAFDNIALGLRLRGTPRQEAERSVREAAELLGITGCLQQRPKELSGGERQRVALARAMVRRPKVFLLDEPLSHLDAPLRRELRGEIAALQERLHATMIYVTHDRLEATNLAHRLAVLHAGVLQQAGPPEELQRNPANSVVADFMTC